MSEQCFWDDKRIIIFLTRFPTCNLNTLYSKVLYFGVILYNILWKVWHIIHYFHHISDS